MNKPNSLIRLNVGGDIFFTYYETLYSSRYFRVLLNNMQLVKNMTVDEDRIFIDRSKELFKYVLQFLRVRHLNLGQKDSDFLDDLREEALFYGINDLVEFVEAEMNSDDYYSDWER
ncbi:hypothetical protein CU098_010333 [Rhizopus stolonifer]|uniref:BTB domain-containing protein n=1 Tax=Rhizopus stolonifer TaxID=4846 RepID=A0A367JS48_RHIST|nr:hypothetical protein CU098_010333 [Rhizopus stolonifer]